jgi:hypothetical protein
MNRYNLLAFFWYFAGFDTSSCCCFGFASFSESVLVLVQGCSSVSVTCTVGLEDRYEIVLLIIPIDCLRKSGILILL